MPIILNEEDQLAHENSVCKSFAEKTAAGADARVKLHEQLSAEQRSLIENSAGIQAGERPLLAGLYEHETQWALITNQRLVWKTAEGMHSCAWSDIRTLESGTAKQRNLVQQIEMPQRKKEARAAWDSLEVTTMGDAVLVLRLESGAVLSSTEWCLMALIETWKRKERSAGDPDAYVAHKYSSAHKAQIQQSEQCGCFNCLKIFPPTDIRKWVDKDSTAMCPRCGLDSVIGSACGYPISEEFLQRMKTFWFE